MLEFRSISIYYKGTTKWKISVAFPENLNCWEYKISHVPKERLSSHCVSLAEFDGPYPLELAIFSCKLPLSRRSQDNKRKKNYPCRA